MITLSYLYDATLMVQQNDESRSLINIVREALGKVTDDAVRLFYCRGGVLAGLVFPTNFVQQVS